MPNTGPDSIVSSALVFPTAATPPLMWPTSSGPSQWSSYFSMSSAWNSAEASRVWV